MSINNPAVNSFSNERIRPFAEKLASVYYEALSLRDEFDAKGLEEALGLSGDWKSVDEVTKQPTDQVEDGRQAEGVTPLTAGDVGRMYRMAAWIIANAEAGDRYMIGQCLKASVRLK